MITQWTRLVLMISAVLLFALPSLAINRALLVISELDQQGVKELSGLYRTIESLTWKIPYQSTMVNRVYSQMHLLSNRHVTVKGLQSALSDLIKDKSVDVVDVILAVHGSPEKLSFYDQTIKVSELASSFKSHIRNELGQATTAKLGLLYNLSCYGVTHIPAFLDMGFKSVVGSRKVNANAELEYPWVLQSLALGRTVAASFRAPNSARWLKVADGPIRWLGHQQKNFLRETDSYKIIGGEANYRIHALPWGVMESEVAAMETEALRPFTVEL